MDSSTILKIENLSVKFDKTEVLRNLSLSVKKGDVVAIVGPNGAGKSVLFKTLLGLIPHSGTIEWQKDLKIGYVPQKLSIEKDLPLSVEEFFRIKNKNHSEILSALEKVGLLHLKDNNGSPHNHGHEEHILQHRLGWLSGGQLQRILIAWSLLDNPDVLLFDEPTAGIDVGGEETIYNLLSKLKEKHNMTILLISHDLNIVYRYANNVLCLNKKMICYGLPATVLDPASLAKLYGEDVNFYKHEH